MTAVWHFALLTLRARSQKWLACALTRTHFPAQHDPIRPAERAQGHGACAMHTWYDLTVWHPPMSAFSNDSCMTFCTSHAPCSFTKMACMRTHAHPFSGPTWSHSACRAGTGPWCLCHAHVVWPYCMTYSQSHTDGRPMYDICTCHASCSWTPWHHARSDILSIARARAHPFFGPGMIRHCVHSWHRAMLPVPRTTRMTFAVCHTANIIQWYTHVWHCLL